MNRKETTIFALFAIMLFTVVALAGFVRYQQPDCRRLINPEPSEVHSLYKQKQAAGCKSVRVEYHKH